MKQKIGIIAADMELMKDITALFPVDVKNGHIIIKLLQEDKMEDQIRELEKEGVGCIIARSGVYEVVTETANVPALNLTITTIDILLAIKKARKYGKDIVLILRDHVYFNYEEWKVLLNVKIELVRFNTVEEAKERGNEFLDRKESIVLIGSGVVTKLGKIYGIDTVFLKATKISTFSTVKQAKKLLQELYHEKLKTAIAETTLDNVHDAVVAINDKGEIILYNKKAEEILIKSHSEVMHKNIEVEIPQLKFMNEILKNKRERQGEIITIGNKIVAANVSLLKVDNGLDGVLCSFQDITKLQKLEKQIRFQLNKKGLVAKMGFEDMIAIDEKMILTIQKAKKIAKTNLTVIIYGESGTGKEVFAQSMHSMSARQDSPFVAINCAAISESLLESELFGYEEGAFTGARKSGKPGLFELAHGGTMFLDEINSISLNLQAKLLRVLEEKEIMRLGSDYIIPLDVRVIAAANEDLREKMIEGKFRRDLFYRLSVLEIKIPPLRERKKDILPLFYFFLRKALGVDTNHIEKLKDQQEKRLLYYEWLGNVRELKNIAQRYSILGELSFVEEEIDQEKEKISIEKGNIDLKDINRVVEKSIIEMLIEQGMTKTEVAKILGISRTALWKKMKGH